MFKAICVFLLLGYFSIGESLDYKKELSALDMIGYKKFDKNETADLILIDFWASWCEPCKESFPYYEAKIKAQKKKILFISINMDESLQKAQDFLKEYPNTHVTLWDEKRHVMNRLGFDSIPFLVILDKNWKEQEKIKGFNEKAKKRIEKYF
ncbi:MAG: TlpA family protein disulfide reductase [Bdellovibrionaceae bacterium]|nr:TlpA family protein disulfide reductase [Pseudobdellovibrionaceae bacterium]